jgi:hypothetical protein
VWVEAPEPGEHRVTLAVGDAEPATVTFRVVDPERDFGGRDPEQPRSAY